MDCNVACKIQNHKAVPIEYFKHKYKCTEKRTKLFDVFLIFTNRAINHCRSILHKKIKCLEETKISKPHIQIIVKLMKKILGENTKIELTHIDRHIMDIETIRSKIGNYELKIHEKSKISVNKTALEKLYNGVHEGSTVCRCAFIEHLKNNVVDIEEKFKNNNSKDPINIKDFLDSKGLVLYKKAIKEEKNSKEFREAVFYEATEHYKGAKWDKQLILWISGPSASGKSSLRQQLVKTVGRQMESADSSNHEGNYVVSIDGGIEREVSQMRQLLLQAAHCKGYSGIKDLHKHTDLNIKPYVRETAIAAKHSLVIPDTFSNLMSLKQMARFARGPQFKQVFSEVVGAHRKNFKDTVYRMGKSRAWKSSPKIPRKITMNNRNIEGESKEYEARFFTAGVRGSQLARNFYKLLSGKKATYIKIVNDLTYVKVTDRCIKKSEKKYHGEVVLLTERQKNLLEDEIASSGSFKTFIENFKFNHREKRYITPEECIKRWLKINGPAKNAGEPILLVT